MDAVKYFEELKRMCRAIGYCANCPFRELKRKHQSGCDYLPKIVPKEAVEIVEKWAAEHPQKTILQDFLEKYPNAVMYDGKPSGVCPYSLGYGKPKEKPCWNTSCSCQDCWNRPLEG